MIETTSWNIPKSKPLSHEYPYIIHVVGVAIPEPSKKIMLAIVNGKNRFFNNTTPPMRQSAQAKKSTIAMYNAE